MNADSLLTSAAINIGLALLILSLYSILRKQPSNAPIYFARRLSLRRLIPFDRHITFRRLLPSVDWIDRALSISEEEIVESSGLDALVLVRLFKFGINFFVVGSLIGLLILLPVNYTACYEPSKSSHSMDSFTISNIGTGSNRLWVHYSCLCFISVYGLHLLHKEYKDILMKRIQKLCNLRHQPNQFTVLVREIPLCGEHKAYGCCVDEFFSKYHPYYHSYQILYDGKDHEDLLNQAKSITKRIEKLRQHSMNEKQYRRSMITHSSQNHQKLRELEETLQGLHSKIHEIRCKKMLDQKELPVAFVTFRSRCSAALAAQSQQHSNPLLWITEMAPEPRDVLWRNFSFPYAYLPLYKIGMFTAASLLTVFFAIPVTAVQGIAKFEKLRKWFPPAMAVQLIPGLRSIVTGYLPSVILSGFIFIVPFAMIAMANLACDVSRSKKDIKACNMVFYFLVGNVFFLSLLSGSLLDQIGEYFLHPKDFPSHLAGAVSSQADFFMTYILTNGLSGFSIEILQPCLLIWDSLKSHTWGRGKNKALYLYSLPYYRIIPFVCLCTLIGMVYAVVSPLLLPFLIGYFLLGYIVFINQIEDVYETTYETCGRYWPYIHHYIIVAIILMQITMIGLFGLKSKPSASFATIPLLVLTIAFNEYCKIRFFPTFNSYAVQDAMQNDKLDDESDTREANSRNALDAYCPPCLRPVDFTVEESSSIQPLMSSTWQQFLG